LGSDHPLTAQSLNKLALLYHAQGKYAQAQSLLKRALAIYEQHLSPDHPDTATFQENYAELLKHMRRKKKRQPWQLSTGTRGDSKTDSKTDD